MNKKRLIIVLCCLIISVTAAVTLFLLLKNKPDEPSPKNKFASTVGVWCWDEDASLDHIEFAYLNGINEIYYNASYFNEVNRNFIRVANSYGIKVYYLCGRPEYILNEQEYQKINTKINKYKEFNEADSSAKFAGIHLDIEPHGNDNFNDDEDFYVEKYIALVERVVTENADIKFDFDIPFWLDHQITHNGQTKEAFKFVFDIASRVFVMSYRDTANAIVSVAADELLYAKENNKPIFLCVDTKDLGEENKHVTSFEEGKLYMYGQLESLKGLVSQTYGLSIHYLEEWKLMKD